MRLLRRLLAALKSQPAPTLPNREGVSTNVDKPNRNGQEVWGGTRSKDDRWRLLGPEESPFDAESWTPGDRLTSGPGLRDEAVGDVSAVSFSRPTQGGDE